MKVIIWIIGLLIYFYAQSRKARKAAAEGEEASGPPARPAKQVTFEDLLREIERSRKPEPPPVPEVIDYDEDIREEAAEPVEVFPERKREEEVTAIYEQARLAAFERTSLEDTVKLQEIPVQPGKFRGYEHDSRPALAASIAQDLRSPETFQKAFILGEVLNRRF